MNTENKKPEDNAIGKGPEGPNGAKGPGRGPGGPMKTEIRKIGDGVYDIAGGFHQYLITGSEKALLIDTGMGLESPRRYIEQVTDLPVILVNTHGHPDHAGGNADFDPAYMCPADFDVFEKMATKEFRIEDMGKHRDKAELEKILMPTGPHPVAIEDGAEFDLGKRKVRVIYTPGHTHGSISLFDEQTRYIFTGDNCMSGMTALHEWNASPISVFEESLKKIRALNPERIYTGHDRTYNTTELVDRQIELCEDVLNGAEGVFGNVRGYEAFLYEKNGTSISYTKDKIC